MNVEVDIPAPHVALVLAGLPLLYVLNWAFNPWATDLFAHGDRSAYVPFWGSVLAIHWIGVALVVGLLRRNGHPLSSIGLQTSLRRLGLVIVGLAAIGFLFVGVAEWVSSGDTPAPTDPVAMVYPATLEERLFFVAVAISAGLCEEIVYRGFGITTLVGVGLGLGAAVGLSTLSFVFIHGPAALGPGFVFYALAGLVLAGIFLRRGRLLPAIVVHAVFDLLAIFALI